ncbi:MAG: very short patch repair endonuclease [Candidatus Cloacimonetes bacterium]|nr:very short patch repair endonuclease [Candidatus Cloacimonadota bacterium]
MSQIKGKNTKIEILIRSALHRNGFRFRVNQSDLPGKPDIVLSKYKAIILVHGCFWHYHGCRYSKIPETRHDWRKNKLSANKERDIRINKELNSLGWRVLIVWECAIKYASKESLKKTLERIESWINSDAECGNIASADDLYG